MASYFDLPQQKAPVETIEAVPETERRKWGSTSLFSPAVTQLLDDLEGEPSDSDSEEANPSEEEVVQKKPAAPIRKESLKPNTDRRGSASRRSISSLSPKKGEHSPNKGSAHGKHSSSRATAGVARRPKQPHMARFHSLRSMLFSSNLENKMQDAPLECVHRDEAAEKKWKQEHEQRQIHARPKTPESDGQGKEGLGTRIKTKIRRMSREIPTMETLEEDGQAHDFSGSTASSDNEEEQERIRPRDADEESINHSDVEDLVRWVSRRDPPSDGEARTLPTQPKVAKQTKADSGHESLGHSDVEDLVRWVSRKSSTPAYQREEEVEQHTGYSDASTESDSEMQKEQESSAESGDDEDADDLVRWISRREGPTAGPVRHKADHTRAKKDDTSDIDSDVPELGRWVTRRDETSGESNAPSLAGDDLLAPPDEPERGRQRSRDPPSRPGSRSHMTHDDVDELVRWVSRKQSVIVPEDEVAPDEVVKNIQKAQEGKKEMLGMSVDEGSLSHGDVLGLVEHVRSREAGPEPERDEGVEKIQDRQESKKELLGMSVDEGSLSHGDVLGLVEHVKSHELSASEQEGVYRGNETGDLRRLRA